MAICCILTLGWGAVQTSKGSVIDALPQTPEDFKPEVRFVVFTDTHNENENVADAIDTAYALFDKDSVYQGIDAFFGLGDFSSIGTEPDTLTVTAESAYHFYSEPKMLNLTV